MKIPTFESKLISFPSNINCFLYDNKALLIVCNCVEITLSTEISMRLNSSKQPQAPVDEFIKYKKKQCHKMKSIKTTTNKHYHIVIIRTKLLPLHDNPCPLRNLLPCIIKP